MPNNNEKIKQLAALSNALTLARQYTSPDITVQRLLILVCVAQHEGLSQRELLARLDGTSVTALSRNLADLSSLNVKKQPGPGLIELRTDPMNLRIKRVHLSRKGRGLVRKVARALGTSLSPGNGRAT